MVYLLAIKGTFIAIGILFVVVWLAVRIWGTQEDREDLQKINVSGAIGFAKIWIVALAIIFVIGFVKACRG